MMSLNKHAMQPQTHASLQEKMEQIKGRLHQLQQGQKVGGAGATLGDDAPLPADKRAAIAREETLVRKALKAVGMDYDALIAQQSTEGKASVYARAIAANPEVLKQVLAADSPVIAALEVAMSFKPIAAFTEKYGTEPEAIRAAIRAEALAEGGSDAPEAAPKPSKALPFSQQRGAPQQGMAATQAATLNSVFRK